MGERSRRAMAGILLLLGVALWLTVGRGVENWNEQIPAVILAGVGGVSMLVGRLRRCIADGVEGFDSKFTGRMGWISIIAGMLACGYFLTTAIEQGRYL